MIKPEDVTKELENERGNLKRYSFTGLFNDEPVKS